MARTKRIYNKDKQFEFFHPYRQICMGNCPMCKKYKEKKRKRTLDKQDILAGFIYMETARS